MRGHEDKLRRYGVEAGGQLLRRGRFFVAHCRLGQNRTLSSLDLDRNEIYFDSKQAYSIVSQIESYFKKCALAHVSLSNNAIGEVGAVGLARGLRVNKTLKGVGLNDNSINVVGMLELANCLKVNDTLEEMHLSGNVGEGVFERRYVDVAFGNAVMNCNYRMQHLELGYEGSVFEFCRENRRARKYFKVAEKNPGGCPPGLWPRLLAGMSRKPDYVWKVLRMKPDVCREPRRERVRSRDEDGELRAD